MLGGQKKRRNWMYFFLLPVVFSLCAGGKTEGKGSKGEVSKNNGGGGTKMEIKSSAFGNGERIPKKYTCEGEDISPPLSWSGVPAEAKSLVLIVDDPDAPIGTFTHWVVYDIPVSQTGLPENFEKKSEVGAIKQGRNDFGRVGWGGPCPPPGHGTHRYFFKLYAISKEKLGLPPGASKSDVMKAMEGNILAQAEFYGTYSR